MTPRRGTRTGICLLALGLGSLFLPLRLLEVKGQSMEPTLRNGERLILDRFYYRLQGGLRDGDLVVIERGKERLIKRIKALPGEEIQLFRDPRERLLLVFNLTLYPNLRGKVTPRREEVIIPPDSIYVMGDNWPLSEDSRSLGPIKLKEVVGIARSWSFSRDFPEPRSLPTAQRTNAAEGRATPG